MGLDMYLRKKTYVGAKYEHRNVKGTVELTEGADNKPIKIKLNRISEIIEEIGYWRKANQIHKWFVDNVQDGEDDCGEYYVTTEKLQELLNICEKVLASTKLIEGVVKNGERLEGGVWMPILEDGKEMENTKLAEELLPSQSGFFFGGTDYDQYYYQDLKDTVEILKEALQDEDADIYYSSSW